MDQYWEDFLQPLDSPCLQLLAARAQEHLPGSGLQCRTALLLAQMRHTEPTEAEPEGEGASGWGHLQSHRGLQCDRQRQFQALRPTQVQSQSRLHHHPDCQLTIRPGQLEHLLRSHGQLQHHQEQELQSRGQVYLHLPRRRSTDRHCPLSRESLLLQQQKRRLASWKRPRGHLHCHLWRERQCPLRRQSRPHLQGQPHPHHQLPCCPWPGPCGDGLREQKPELLAFPPKLVAEQLSLMDAELFKKVVPYHCLGSIWSQRHQKGKEHVAPTVRAVISQFNRVADCVKATCLGDHSMKVADRARVVEHWIEVTRECQTLRNFSSGHAILSALERHVIGHQKKTWAEVSRDSFRLFQTLSEIFSSESDSSQGSELISQGAIQGTVPWLGTFLTQFSMVDSAMQEFLNGTMVNFDKRRKEDQLVAELQKLQARCCYDCLVPDGRFRAWFEAVEQLGQKDSLLLSREWKPPPESASESFQAQHPLGGSEPWSRDRQGPDAESSGSGSTARSSVQLQGGPDVSSGDAADSPHLPVAGSSSSAVEIHLNHVPEAQDCQEAKPGQPTCASSPIGSTVPSASGGTSSSSSIQARATRTSRKPQDSWPRHKRHVGDRCFVRVTLAEDSGHKVQSILVTDQDRAPAVIRKALEEHELAGEQPEDYQLVQIISGDGTLQIPDGANVYYAMAPSPDYRFLLLRKTTPLDAEVKERALSALRGSRQKGPRFQKGKL
nr:ral guanine nucleotide dissociation stimulator-like [Dasypus novemcinctus]